MDRTAQATKKLFVISCIDVKVISNSTTSDSQQESFLGNEQPLNALIFQIIT
jgi:hypothetical protein